LSHAQQAGATLSGTVTDAIGGVLQSATINVKNEATGTAKSVEVDPQGHFSLSGLAPGRYKRRSLRAGLLSQSSRGPPNEPISHYGYPERYAISIEYLLAKLLQVLRLRSL